MKKRGFLAGALALALLTGCGGGDGGDLAADPDDIAFQAASLRRDSEIVTVDGQPVRAEAYLFWLANSIGTAQQYGVLADDAAWDEAFDDGMTMSEALKADALETAKLYRVVETKAAEYGVTLTQEVEDQIAEELQQAEEDCGGADAFQTRLDEMCISREGFMDMNRIYYLNQALREKLEESGELDITQADRDAYEANFLEENGIYAAKHILISTRRESADGSGYEDFSDEEKAAALEKAQDLREQLRTAGDSAELFDELMEEYSEDSRDENGELYYPDGYGLVYAGQMVPEFEAGALALEVGQISEPVQTDYGYHIILRTDLDRERLDQIVQAGCSADSKMQELTQKWLDEAVVVTTTAYDELDPKTFYEQLTAVNEARAAAKAAAASETPAESAEAEETPAE